MNKNEVSELEKSLELKMERKISNFISKNSNRGYNRNEIMGYILTESFL